MTSHPQSCKEGQVVGHGSISLLIQKETSDPLEHPGESELGGHCPTLNGQNGQMSLTNLSQGPVLARNVEQAP